MASILFIDDDPVFLEAITEYFEDMATESATPQRTRVYSAQGARKAITILKQAKISVTVTDIKLREVDGIQFLAMLSKHFPNMSKVVLSTLPSDDHRESAISAGAMVYLEKAKSREEVKQVIASIKAVLATSGEEYADLKNNMEVRAAIARFCNPGIKTTLFIKTERFIGRVIIFDGHIVHCAAAKLVGLDALKLLLNLETAQYKTDEYEKPTQITIQDGTWEGLVGVQSRPMGTESSAGSNNSGLAGMSGIIGRAPGQGPANPIQGSGLMGKSPGATAGPGAPTGKSASDIARNAIRPVNSGSGTSAGKPGSGLVSKPQAPGAGSGLVSGSGLISGSGLTGRPLDSNRSNIRPVTGGSGLISRPGQGPSTPALRPTTPAQPPAQPPGARPTPPSPQQGSAGSGLVSRPGQGPANPTFIKPPTPAGAPPAAKAPPGQPTPAAQVPKPAQPPVPPIGKPAPPRVDSPNLPTDAFLEIEDDDLLIDELTRLDDDDAKT
jgi:DNA-binding NarL/FixJ family response regulator